MNPLAWVRARRAAKHQCPWAEGELPRMGVEVKALAKRDRRAWWKGQRAEGRRLLKDGTP
jgi:hypothetical protein